jgi:two-component system, chemotaxis family, protein-glutamate methylesterase/glutaminase
MSCSVRQTWPGSVADRRSAGSAHTPGFPTVRPAGAVGAAEPAIGRAGPAPVGGGPLEGEPPDVGGRGVVAVGGSAGGIEALVAMVAGLPPDLPACVLVTVHIGERARSKLPRILERAGPLPAQHALHEEPLRAGRIYVAPPGFHLLATRGIARLSAGPRVNRHRPAIDVMFGSTARWAGDRVVAVVLSGVLDDGAVGAALVAHAGGQVVVQDPAEALFASMPRAALVAAPDAVVQPTAKLGRTVAEMIDARGPAGLGDVHRQMEPEMSMADSSDPRFLAADESRLTRLTCPDCGGSLAEVRLSRITYYRCHVGHQFGPKTLEAAQAEAAERKLWSGVAALEDHAALARHLAGVDSHNEDAVGYRKVAERAADLAEEMRSHLDAPGRPEVRR